MTKKKPAMHLYCRCQMKEEHMKTLGAKFDDQEYGECQLIIEQLGISRSEYVRKALRLFNSVHHYRRLTEKDYPTGNVRELEKAGQSDSSEWCDRADSDISTTGGCKQDLGDNQGGMG